MTGTTWISVFIFGAALTDGMFVESLLVVIETPPSGRRAYEPILLVVHVPCHTR